MIDLERRPEISVLARISGKVLTVIVLNGAVVKLVRTLELGDLSREEMLDVLLPTMAFIEDQFHARPARVVFCGVDNPEAWEAELGVPVELLMSKFGFPNQYNAGLHGYLQSMSEGSGVNAA
jgi:type IV pilus assembly protein PilM